MLHNKEVKQLIFVEILIFLLCLGVGYVAYQVIEERYEQEIIEKNAYLVSSLVSKHPEWEEDIIDALTTYSGSYENGLTILEKYGLDDMEFCWQKNIQNRFYSTCCRIHLQQCYVQIFIF